MMTPAVSIVRFAELAETSSAIERIDAIFFDASNTKSFDDAASQLAFRERWLGRYMAHDQQWFYVAIAPDGEIAGYLAGSLDDPARTPRFSDIPYFANFKHLTRLFPAHLHVNLRPQSRGSGAGSGLVARFAADAAQAGSPGVHVVTGRGARNVHFYERNGFFEQGAVGEGTREVVFLGRTL